MAEMDTGPTSLFAMAKLKKTQTGLPFVVWAFRRGDARLDVRVKVTRTGHWIEDEAVTVALRPFRAISDWKWIDRKGQQALRQWMELNHDALVAFWNAGFEYDDDFRAQIRPLPPSKEVKPAD